MYFLISSSYGKYIYLCLYYYLMCRRGIKHFDVHFRWIRPAISLSNDEKDAVYDGRKFLFHAKVGFFSLWMI